MDAATVDAATVFLWAQIAVHMGSNRSSYGLAVHRGSNRSLSELLTETRMDIYTEGPTLFYVEMQKGGQWRASWDNCS